MAEMTLDQVVREYLLEAQLPEHKYVQALQFGISCLRELNFDVTGVPVIKNLTVNADDTVDLPNDYINYIRLGFTDSTGGFQELGRNNLIALNRNLDDCGVRTDRIPSDSLDPQQDALPGSYTDYYSTHFRNGQNVGAYYGMGGGNNANGLFRIDKAYNQIQLEGYRGGDTITLEYLSDPAKAKGEFLVIPFAIETVKSYIQFKMALNHPRMKSDAPYLKTLHGKQIKKLRARLKSVSVQDILQSFRLANKQSPKF